MADDRGCSLGAVGLAFVTGGLAGAAVALLLAPQSGRESREQVRGYARRAEEQVHELADKATESHGPGGGQGTRVRPGEKDGLGRGGRGRAHRHAAGA